MTSFDKWLSFYLSYMRPVIDVCFLALILFKVYAIIKQTHGMQLVKGGILLLLLYATAMWLQLSTLLWLLNTLAPGLLIGIAIVFQPELRKIFIKLGQSHFLQFSAQTKHTYIDPVLTAADMLSKQRRGMLVVFIRHTELKDIAESGTRINADISSSMLVTIFGHDTPLHDGAVLVQNGKIMAAGCFLPLSEQQDIKKTFGTRHRAALGVSEETDAVVLIVSEETGAISLAYDSHLYYDLPTEQLTKTLEKELDLKANASHQKDGMYETESAD